LMEDTNQKMDHTQGTIQQTNEKMDQTNEKMDQMIETSQDLKEGQEFMGGFEAFFDGDKPYGARAAAFETMVKLAKEDRLGKYLGLPLSLVSIPALNEHLPNVSIVSEHIVKIKAKDPREDLKVPTIDPDSYAVALTATEKMVKELLGLAKKNMVTPEKKLEVQENFSRFAQAFTAVLAAKAAVEQEDGSVLLMDIVSAEERKVFAFMLTKLAEAYEVSDEANASLNLHIQKKLNSLGSLRAEFVGAKK